MIIDSTSINLLRKQFPILEREVAPSIPLIYLDSAATAQKPSAVINAMTDYYISMNSNIHRGVHTLAEEATAAYESARSRIANFIHCKNAKEIIFTRNATEAINLVAYSWGRKYLKKDDLVILTEMEHHSNLVPWQILAQEMNINLEFIPVTGEGLLDLDSYLELLEKKPKLVSFTHVSNVLGTINPVEEIIHYAHAAGAVTLVDGAQSTPHLNVDVEQLNADFFVFSAHKMCGPTGIGVLFGKEDILETMPPFMGGGDMIRKVELRSFKSNELPHKFEAGTPAIAEVIGFGAAVDFLDSIGMENITAYENELVRYALEQLGRISELHVIGPSAEKRSGVASFTLEGVHPHDVAQILDTMGIAIRAGHHCAMPLHARFGLDATSRASFYLYNTKNEIDHFMKGIDKVIRTFR